MRTINKKGGKKKEGNLPKPLPSFSFFRPLLSLFPTSICSLSKDTHNNWYRKSTYSGRVLNFISNHPFQNKVAIIKNLVDRAVCLSHESFYSENLDVVRQILFFNHNSQDLIKKHIKIRIEQVKSKQSSFLKNNSVYVEKFKIHTIFRIPFGMEGHNFE